MLKTIALIGLCLIPLSGCSNNIEACPKRPEFSGVTWGDLARYTGSLERIYDSCANEK